MIIWILALDGIKGCRKSMTRTRRSAFLAEGDEKVGRRVARSENVHHGKNLFIRHRKTWSPYSSVAYVDPLGDLVINYCNVYSSTRPWRNCSHYIPVFGGCYVYPPLPSQAPGTSQLFTSATTNVPTLGLKINFPFWNVKMPATKKVAARLSTFEKLHQTAS